MKKFELTSESIVNNFGKKLFRIKALMEFGNVKEGELGGFVEKEENLSHEGNAWVFDNASVSGDAKVFGDARVFDNAWVFDNASVSGDARVFDNAWVFDNASVSGDAKVFGDAWVSGNARVSGDAEVFGEADVFGDAKVCGNAKVSEDADYTTVKGFGTKFRTTTFFRCKDGVTRVRCGCFYGDLEHFRKQVKATRKGKIAEEYLMIADLMEKHFKEE